MYGMKLSTVGDMQALSEPCLGDGRASLASKAVATRSTIDFLAGDGAMAATMRAFDWSSSSLGRPDTWPAALRAAVRTMLNTRHPVQIFWGADGALLYNDGFRETLDVDPSATLGRPVRKVAGYMWPVIGPQIEQVMAGGPPTWNENQLIPIVRNGQREDVYWTYSYGPIDDPTAPEGVGGVLGICSVTTATVVAESRMAAQFERQRALFQQAPGFMAMLRGPDHRYEFANAAYRRLVGNRNLIGRTVAEALPETVEQGYTALLDQVFRSGEAFVAKGAKYSMRETADAPSVDFHLDFIYQPVTDDDGQVTGICVQGTDVTELIQAMAALRALATVDQLTGLPNRGAMIEVIQRAIATQHRRALAFSLLYLDLDGFKRLNDEQGHGVGDEALREVATVLKHILRKDDVAGRLGGDEFVVLVAGDDAAACGVAERLRAALEAGMLGRGWSVTTSIGAVAFATPPDDVDAALAAADAMMYAAKSAGGNRVCLGSSGALHSPRGPGGGPAEPAARSWLSVATADCGRSAPGSGPAASPARC
jgi:diguanylate cyclase (GGDEF)-like protein